MQICCSMLVANTQQIEVPLDLTMLTRRNSQTFSTIAKRRVPAARRKKAVMNTAWVPKRDSWPNLFASTGPRKVPMPINEYSAPRRAEPSLMSYTLCENSMFAVFTAPSTSWLLPLMRIMASTYLLMLTNLHPTANMEQPSSPCLIICWALFESVRLMFLFLPLPLYVLSRHPAALLQVAVSCQPASRSSLLSPWLHSPLPSSHSSLSS
mmetsp:Transcript_660/g.2320  ORF Transcript_660/g.2320 Transcript_660/m.2320 type:complete len:209 (-) Transcript_660:54-680(-)